MEMKDNNIGNDKKTYEVTVITPVMDMFKAMLDQGPNASIKASNNPAVKKIIALMADEKFLKNAMMNFTSLSNPKSTDEFVNDFISQIEDDIKTFKPAEKESIRKTATKTLEAMKKIFDQDVDVNLNSGVERKNLKSSQFKRNLTRVGIVVCVVATVGVVLALSQALISGMAVALVTKYVVSSLVAAKAIAYVGAAVTAIGAVAVDLKLVKKSKEFTKTINDTKAKIAGIQKSKEDNTAKAVNELCNAIMAEAKNASIVSNPTKAQESIITSDKKDKIKSKTAKSVQKKLMKAVEPAPKVIKPEKPPKNTGGDGIVHDEVKKFENLVNMKADESLVTLRNNVASCFNNQEKSTMIKFATNKGIKLEKIQPEEFGKGKTPEQASKEIKQLVKDFKTAWNQDRTIQNKKAVKVVLENIDKACNLNIKEKS